MTAIIYSFSALISSIIVSFIIGYLFALCILFMVVVIISVGFNKNKSALATENVELDNYVTSGSEAEQALKAIKVVKAYGQEGNEINKFKDHLNQSDRDIERVGITYGISRALSEATLYLGCIFSLVMTAIFIFNEVSKFQFIL